VKRLRTAILLLGLALSLGGLAGVRGVARADNDVPQCIEVEAIVRYGGAAYNHWVRIDNGCAQRAVCRVATDVNPDPQTVEVAAGDRTEVLTFRGSPARTFEPRVSCDLDR
jgi:hypothetical protein